MPFESLHPRARFLPKLAAVLALTAFGFALYHFQLLPDLRSAIPSFDEPQLQATGYGETFELPSDERSLEERYAADPARSFEGVILDWQGRALPGAIIEFTAPRAGGEIHESVEVRADARGEFHESIPIAEGHSELDLLVAESPDSGTPRYPMRASLGNGRLELKLPRTLPVKVIVEDLEGNPFEDFELWVYGGSKAGGDFRRELEHYEGGVVEFRVPPGKFGFKVSRECQFLAEEIFVASTKQTEFRVSARPVRWVTGSVVSDRGDPVPHALVELVKLATPDMVDYVAGEKATRYERALVCQALQSGMKTDELGNFRFPMDEIGTGYYYARAWSPTEGEAVSSPLVVNQAGVRLVLKPGGSVEGSSALTGGFVHLWREFGWPGGCGLSGRCFIAPLSADGHFAFEHVPEGTWRVSPLVDLEERDHVETEHSEQLVEVREGFTSSIELDTHVEWCRVEGLVEGFTSGTGLVELHASTWDRPQVAIGTIEPGGSFQLFARQPGRYWLTVTYGSSHHATLTYVDCVDVSASGTRWNLGGRKGNSKRGVFALCEDCE